MIVINRVEVSRFKTFLHADVTLGGLNVLHGPHGSGKSNFLDFFELLDAIQIRQLHQWDARIFYGSETRGPTTYTSNPHTPLMCNIHFDGCVYSFLLRAHDGYLKIAEERWHSPKTGSVIRTEPGVCSPETLLLPLSLDDDGERTVPEFTPRRFDLSKLSPQGDNSGQYAVLGCEGLTDNADNLVNYLYLNSKNSGTYGRIKDLFRLAAPQFADFYFNEDCYEGMDVIDPAVGPAQVSLKWLDKQGRKYDLDQLTERQYQVLAYIALLMGKDLVEGSEEEKAQEKLTRVPEIWLIDNCFDGLAVYETTILGRLLLAKSRDVQIIAATNNVALWYSLGSEANRAQLARPDQETWISLSRDEALF